MSSCQLKVKSPWQAERAKILQRACLSVTAGIRHGERISRTIRRVSRRYHGRALRSDPKRRLALAPGTLRYLWDRWRRNGEVPAAFKLHYYGRPPYVPRPLVIRFAQFSASRRLTSVKEAWRMFSQIRGNSAARGISYQQVVYSFPAAEFYRMQAELRAIETARARLEAVKFKAIAEITNRLPLRVPHRRSTQGNDSQL